MQATQVPSAPLRASSLDAFTQSSAASFPEKLPCVLLRTSSTRQSMCEPQTCVLFTAIAKEHCSPTSVQCLGHFLIFVAERLWLYFIRHHDSLAFMENSNKKNPSVYFFTNSTCAQSQSDFHILSIKAPVVCKVQFWQKCPERCHRETSVCTLKPQFKKNNSLSRPRIPMNFVLDQTGNIKVPGLMMYTNEDVQKWI